MLEDLWGMSKSGTLEKLSPAECLSAYGIPTQSTRRNLLVVTANENVAPRDYPYINNTNFGTIMREDARQRLKLFKRDSSALSWICSGLAQRGPCMNFIEGIKNAPEPWTLAGFNCGTGIPGECDGTRWPIKYCLSERAELQCSLNFSPVIAWRGHSSQFL